jgi:hypothetical protein
MDDNYDSDNWINNLVNYWIKRTNSINKNTYNQNMDIIIKPYININYEVMPCIYKDNCIINSIAPSNSNVNALPRIKWYTDYFNKINNNYSFTFLLNHLDIFTSNLEIDNLNMISFGGSINYNNYKVIPIIDAHHLWDVTKFAVYNPNYVIDFDNTPYENKINKIVWRGSLYPTFLNNGTLIELRKELCNKWIHNKHFNIGVINSNSIINKEYLTIKEFTKYKYILSIDGFGSTYDAIIWKLRSTSLIIWITDENNNMYSLGWFYPLLKPYVHYVPSSIDNLENTFKWCEENSTKCKEIIENSTKLIKNILLNTDKYHKCLFDKLNETNN